LLKHFPPFAAQDGFVGFGGFPAVGFLRLGGGELLERAGRFNGGLVVMRREAATGEKAQTHEEKDGGETSNIQFCGVANNGCPALAAWGQAACKHVIVKCKRRKVVGRVPPRGGGINQRTSFPVSGAHRTTRPT
jgi:hypothetical protein